MVTGDGGIADIYARWARLESLPAASTQQQQDDERTLRRAVAELDQERQRRLETVRRAQDALRTDLSRALEAARQRGVQPGRPVSASTGAPDTAAVERICQELDRVRAVRVDLNAQAEAARAKLRQVEEELKRERRLDEALARARARDRIAVGVAAAVALVGFLLGSSVLGVMVVLGGAAFVAHHLFSGDSAIVLRRTNFGPGLSDGARGALAMLFAGAYGVVALLITAASPKSCEPFGQCGPAVLPAAAVREVFVLAFSGWGSAAWVLALLGALVAVAHGTRYLANARSGRLDGS
jgi:hypothetical protein